MNRDSLKEGNVSMRCGSQQRHHIAHRLLFSHKIHEINIYIYIYVDDFIGSNYEHRFSFLFSFLFQCKNADETVEDRGGSAGVGIERRQAPENR